MLTLVLGGASSGKSAFAEELVLSRPAAPVYLATMRCVDPESLRRVERHRVQRAGKGFLTVERPFQLADAPVPANSVVLVEALTTLLANEHYLPAGCGPDRAVAKIWEGILALEQRSLEVVVVSDLLFSDGGVYDPQTEQYRAQLGELHRLLSGRAARVVEVVYSIPVWWKGGYG